MAGIFAATIGGNYDQTNSVTLMTQYYVTASVFEDVTGGSYLSVGPGEDIGVAGTNFYMYTSTPALLLLNNIGFTAATGGYCFDMSGLDSQAELYGGEFGDRLVGGIFSASLYGRGGDDTLIGGNGNDDLDGGAGADTMEGGAGADLYRVDDAGDVVIEAAVFGADIVYSTVSWVMTDNVESLILEGVSNINARGNDSRNNIEGNDGDNKLIGGGGQDQLYGMTAMTGSKVALVATAWRAAPATTSTGSMSSMITYWIRKDTTLSMPAAATH